MRIIPVIDLLGGRAVHAFKGERERYRPVQSVLCPTPDPLALARAFRNQLGMTEIYIADLDAIQSSVRSDHRELIISLARKEKMKIILDAGSMDADDAGAWLEAGIHKVVIGAETLREWRAVTDIPAKIHPEHLVFSLDLHAGNIVSKCPDLAGMPLREIPGRLQTAGWKEIILLDLRRVGSKIGTNHALIREIRERYPALSLLIGGGVTGPGELGELLSMGIAGALVATAFHNGSLTKQDLSALLPTSG
jgi:phosphoribosylformimino-5-aminoimidazole carboxamide ribotide isomerase